MPGESDDEPYALVVDDDPFVLIDASDILADAGFRSLEAGGVEEALRVLELHGEDITLLFTDVRLDGERDGFELAREAVARWPNLHVLVASGQVRPKPGDLPDGAVFMQKPFSAAIVRDRLRELLPEGEKPAPLKPR